MGPVCGTEVVPNEYEHCQCFKHIGNPYLPQSMEMVTGCAENVNWEIANCNFPQLLLSRYLQPSLFPYRDPPTQREQPNLPPHSAVLITRNLINAINLPLLLRQMYKTNLLNFRTLGVFPSAHTAHPLPDFLYMYLSFLHDSQPVRSIPKLCRSHQTSEIVKKIKTWKVSGIQLCFMRNKKS